MIQIRAQEGLAAADQWLAQQPTQAVSAGEPSDPQIREALLACGYTIKPGCDDLMPYVYDGARAVLALRKR